MTPAEYGAALSGLSDEDFERFKNSWGGAANRSREQCVEELVYAQEPARAQYEQTIIYRLEKLGIKGLKTEADKGLEISRQAADAQAAAAVAAQDSAVAARDSARSSRTAVRAAWWACGLSIMGIIVNLALARHC